jgi:hypothetical protein
MDSIRELFCNLFESQVRILPSVIIELTDDSEWVELLKKVHTRRIQIPAFANNHHAGHGPDTVRLFCQVWEARD